MKKWIGLAIVILFVVANFQNCAPGFRTAIPFEDNRGTPAVTAQGNNIPQDFLNKNWGQTCYLKSPSLGVPNDSFYFYRFSNATAVQKIVNYHTTTTPCQNPAYTVDMAYDFELRASNLGPQIYEVDLHLKSYTVTPNSQGATDSFNANSYLGFNDWTLNMPKAIAPLSSYPDLRVHTYDLLRIEPARISWGDAATGDGTAPAKRPTQINTADFELPLN